MSLYDKVYVFSCGVVILLAITVYGYIGINSLGDHVMSWASFCMSFLSLCLFIAFVKEIT